MVLTRPSAPSARLCSSNAITAVLLLVAAGCASHTWTCDRADVSHQLEQRIGHDIGPPSPWAGLLPPGACLEDGLAEDEAVVIALWNNASFQEVLVDLDLSRADLIQAKLLPNPELWYLSPIDVKQLEYAVEFPIEVLWLRPFRIASARRESERTCARLVQSGLNLMRDVRQAYADLVLAHGRLQVAEEAVRLRGRVAQLAEARLKAGDAGPPETAAARIDALQAQQDLVRVRYDVTLAEETLRNLLALGNWREPLLVEAATTVKANLDPDALTAEAVANRPDAVAADQAVLAAEERVRLARLSWFRFLGIIDANGSGQKGHEIGPGFRVTLPIFNQGQGLVARAEAELERAVRQRTTVHDQILLDVNRAFAQYEQARAELDYLVAKVHPEVEAAIRRSERAYQEGNVSYLLVLESTRQLLDSRLRAAQLQANLHRAWAELERSVGRRLELCASEPLLPAPRPAEKEVSP